MTFEVKYPKGEFGADFDRLVSRKIRSYAGASGLDQKHMEINIHTPHLHTSEDAAREEVTHALQRFEERLTRVDVSIKDLNADKGGRDKRCTIEARPRGLDPVSVEDDGNTTTEAVAGAAKKMQRHLDHVLGKRGGHRG